MKIFQSISKAHTMKAFARLSKSKTLLASLLVLSIGTSIGAFASGPAQTSRPDSATVEQTTNSLPNPLQKAVKKLRHSSATRQVAYKVDEAAIATTPATMELPVLDTRLDSYLKLSSTGSTATKVHTQNIVITLNTEVVDKSKLHPGHVGLEGLPLAKNTQWARMPEELKTAIATMKADGYTVYNAVIDNAVVLQKVVPVTSRSRFQQYVQVRMIGVTYSTK